MEIEIINLFPIQIANIKLPEKYSHLISILDEQKLRRDEETGQPNLYGARSENSYILDIPQLSDLKHFILDAIENYSTDILRYKPETKYRITQSWISVKNPNQEHILHSHPNSYISGVFYYGKYDNNTPGIMFRKPGDSIPNTPIFTHHYPNEEEQHKADHAYLPTLPGNLYLFPSWLRHSVPKNTTSLPRKSLAFNSIPKGILGNEGMLTELKPE